MGGGEGVALSPRLHCKYSLAKRTTYRKQELSRHGADEIEPHSCGLELDSRLPQVLTVTPE
jgi:hypothetical protein